MILAALTDAVRQELAESAPEHVAQVKRLVFDPLSAATSRPHSPASPLPCGRELEGG